MARMRYPRSPASICTCLSLWLAGGCISDHTVESDVPAAPGIVQPETNGMTQFTATEACGRIKEARAAVATKLGCDDPADRCPDYLRLAGSVPCDQYVASTVDACEQVIEKYVSCSDFSTKPCVVTPIAGSCKKPVAPEAGGAPRDSGKTLKDGGAERDGSADAKKPDG
jgi:hypothetical protein